MINHSSHALPAKRGKVRPADKLQVKAAKFLPLVGLVRFKQTQSTMGSVLSIYTAPRQPGPILPGKQILNADCSLLPELEPTND